MYRKFVLLFFIYTLFGFKLSITGHDNGSFLSSIRIDDLFLILFLFVFFLSGGSFYFFLKKKPVLFFLIYIFVSILSTLINSIFGEVDFISSMLFTLRPLEYFMYISLGYEIARLDINIEKIFKFYVGYVVFLILGQTLGIIGGISNFSFNRAIANTGGPWELAAVGGFLTIYFFENKKLKFSLAGFIILLLTQSRITLVGTLITFLIKKPSKFLKIFFNNMKLISISTLSLALLLSYVLYKQEIIYSSDIKNDSDGVASRFESFGNDDTLNEIERIFTYSQAAHNRQDYFNKTYGSGLNEILNNSTGGDASSFVRFTRWMVLIKTTINNLRSTIIGLGPSYADKAVDGNYVRLFVETGGVGICCYIIFLFSIYSNIDSRLIKDYILIIAITALFIDIFVTFKAMFLLWFFYGYYLFYKKNKIEGLK